MPTLGHPRPATGDETGWSNPSSGVSRNGRCRVRTADLSRLRQGAGTRLRPTEGESALTARAAATSASRTARIASGSPGRRERSARTIRHHSPRFPLNVPGRRMMHPYSQHAGSRRAGGRACGSAPQARPAGARDAGASRGAAPPPPRPTGAAAAAPLTELSALPHRGLPGRPSRAAKHALRARGRPRDSGVANTSSPLRSQARWAMRATLRTLPLARPNPGLLGQLGLISRVPSCGRGRRYLRARGLW